MDRTRELYLPPTRFFGSKRRLAPWIKECLQPYRFDTVLDLFGGTATVSMLLAQMGKRVVYQDGLEANRICARALTGCPLALISSDQMTQLVESVEPRIGFVASTFRGMYYTDDENAWIDGFLDVLNEVESVDVREIYLYCLFQACLQKRPFNMFHRANVELRHRKVSRSFGNLTTWERPFLSLMLSALSVLTISREAVGQRVEVMHDAVAPTKIRQEADLVYIDPPYLRAGRSNESYISRYHFLEGMSLRRDWNKLINPNTQNRRFADGYFAEDWEDVKRFPELLGEVLSVNKSSIVVLSYAEDRCPTSRNLESMFKQFFKQVHTHRYKTNLALSSAGIEELLIIGEPRR